MKTMRRLIRALENLTRANRLDRDLQGELTAAFEWLVDEKVRSGMTIEDARRAARLDLGSLESLKDQVRDARAGAAVDIHRVDVPERFDTVSGAITCVTKKVYRMEIRFRGSEIRRG